MRKLFLCLTFMTSLNSFAVITKECPRSLKISYSNLIVRDINKVQETANYIAENYVDQLEHFEKYRKEVESDIREIMKLSNLEINLKLIRKSGSKCSYAWTESRGLYNKYAAEISGKNPGKLTVYNSGVKLSFNLLKMNNKELKFDKVRKRPLFSSYGGVYDSRSFDMFTATLGFVDSKIVPKF